MPTQPSISSGSVNEDQLWLGRQRQVWFIPFADECGACRYNCEILWEHMPYLRDLEVCSRRGAIQIHICLTLCLPSACGVSVSTPQRNSQAEWTWEAGFLLDIITFNWYRYRSWNSLVQHHFSSVWEHFLHWTQSMYTYWIVAYWENFLASLSRCSMARCTSYNIQAKIAT